MGIEIVLGCYLIARAAQWYFYRRLGGVNGDCLGATEQILEIFVLLLFTVKTMILPIANPELEARIRSRLDSLTKPPGSLGRLEEIALRVGLIQNTAMPAADRKAMLIFCADHGIVEEGVSPYPAEVTRQMWANFQAGGAAINVLCRTFGIEPVIVDMGVGRPTRNFAREPAMTREEAADAIEDGRKRADARGNSRRGRNGNRQYHRGGGVFWLRSRASIRLRQRAAEPVWTTPASRAKSK